MMARPRRELAIADLAQGPAHRVLARRDAELLVKPLREIGDPPAHHAMGGRDRSFVHPPCQGRQMIGAEQRSLARRIAVDEPLRSLSVEPLNLVADDLRRRAAEPGRRRPARPLIDSRDRQKPARLRPILRARAAARQRSASKSSRKGKAAMANSSVRHLESDLLPGGNPPSQSQCGLV